MPEPRYDAPGVVETAEFAAAVIPGSPEAAEEAERMDTLVAELSAAADVAVPLTDEQLEELARLDAV
jgi:hypothetical protein